MTMIPSLPPEPERHETRAIPFSWGTDSSEQLSMRQLRHHTKTALQSLINQVSTCAGLQQDAAGRALARDLAQRIRLSASISDALFGLTRTPRPLYSRLELLGRAVVSMLSDPDQDITLEVAVHGRTLPGVEDALVRVANEMIGNAIKHGMTLRMIGNIDVTVDARDGGVTMTVSDDGWGLCEGGGVPEARGEGLRIAELLADQVGGAITLHRDRCRTLAMLRIPAGPPGRTQ